MAYFQVLVGNYLAGLLVELEGEFSGAIDRHEQAKFAFRDLNLDEAISLGG